MWKGLELLHLEQSPLVTVAEFCLDLMKLGELVDDMALIPWLFVFPETTDKVCKNFDRFAKATSKVSNFLKSYSGLQQVSL